MPRPTPRHVFENPNLHRAFITSTTDDHFEDQHFDRKEAGQIGADGRLTRSQLSHVIDQVTECVSAFTNSNVEGGLLVLGIASDGRIQGVDHLSESERNSITSFDNLLINQSVEVKFVDCQVSSGISNRLLLIFAPYCERAICETPSRNPKAWIRSGSQNVPLTQTTRDRLRQQKRIIDFENTFCCEFDLSETDQHVVAAFRPVFVPDGIREMSDEELLFQAGAIQRDGGKLHFTNAGLLFFAANPQRILTGAHIRLLRFQGPSEDRHNRGLPTLDKPFTGPLTKQIRDARTFFRESGFFKIYQTRKASGGFTEQPEYPVNVVDEAIVNAVTHRDYAIGFPIELEKYSDALIVLNPGRMMQRDVDLPEEFTLADRVLDSMPRNPKLLRWLQIMKDPEGRAYVQAISEGTKQMALEMAKLNLPPPKYRLTESQTILKLESNAQERDAALLSQSVARSTEFTNLYPMTIQEGAKSLDAKAFNIRYREFLTTFRDILRAHDWYIDRFSFSRIIAHRRGASLDIPQAAASILRFYPAYVFQVRQYWGSYYLCVDYTIQVLNVRRLNALTPHFQLSEFIGRMCVAEFDGWKEGKIIASDGEWVTVLFFENEKEAKLPAASIVPHCSLSLLDRLLKVEGVSFDLHKAVKRFSFASETAAARKRADKIVSMVEHASQTLFPVAFGNFKVSLDTQPVHLIEHGKPTRENFVVGRLSEPAVEFREQHATTDVREGITKFGSYSHSPHDLELVPVCTSSCRQKMEQLIERLKVGKYKYRGAERTFATKFTYSTIITVDRPEDIRYEVQRILNEHPDWSGERSLRRIFIIHTPEHGYAADDHTSPYYVVKRFLLEAGVPCQMVDTPTLSDPDWKDLNLALNITAKCGITPWVLPDAIPDADFFIGLSYTQSRDKQKIMGFANVFNQYGKWEFYSGNTAYFEYDERVENFSRLVRETLERLTLQPTPNIIFHYSARLSRDDRNAMLRAARSIRPEGTYTFVWTNNHHNVRIFDSRPETDGSLRRGSFMPTSFNESFLSTTGYNPFRRPMGTPKPLQITAWVDRPQGLPNATPDMKALAVQVLSLTKLNWASTDAFCGEPITLKYAGDIAYLAAAFLRQSEPFKLHPALERSPWFL